MSETSATRVRFLGAIAAQVQPSAIVEAHLFQPIRQSGFESGVAVVAVAEQPAPPSTQEDESLSEAGDPQADSDAPLESGPKLAVYTAKYRLTLKGPDRGKWDFSMTAEADAPLVTVDAVVRGVQRRSGDVEEPEKLSGDEFRELLPADEPTTATPSSS